MNTHHIKEDGLQQQRNTLVDHSCQLRKENWGYTLAWLTKQNIGKMCPGLMISAATFTGSQFGIDNTCNTAMWITLWPQSTHLLTAVSSSIMCLWQRSGHLKLASWKWELVHCTQMGTTVTRSQASKAPEVCDGPQMDSSTQRWVLTGEHK